MTVLVDELTSGIALVLERFVRRAVRYWEMSISKHVLAVIAVRGATAVKFTTVPPFTALRCTKNLVNTDFKTAVRRFFVDLKVSWHLPWP